MLTEEEYKLAKQNKRLKDTIIRQERVRRSAYSRFFDSYKIKRMSEEELIEIADMLRLEADEIYNTIMFGDKPSVKQIEKYNKVRWLIATADTAMHR